MSDPVSKVVGIPIHRSAKAAENGRILRIQYHLCFHTRVSEGRYQKRNVVRRLAVTFHSPGLWNTRRKSPGDARPGVEDAAMGGDPPSPPFRPHPAPRHPRVSLVPCSVTDLKMFNNKKSNYKKIMTRPCHSPHNFKNLLLASIPKEFAWSRNYPCLKTSNMSDWHCQ